MSPPPTSPPPIALVTWRTLPPRFWPMIVADGPGFLTAITHRFGDAVLLRWGRHRFYIFNHPDLVEELLITKGRQFSKPPVVPQLRSIFGQGLLTSDGELHRRQRRLMQPAFLRSRIDSYGETIAHCAQLRRDSWTDGQQLDIAHEMGRLTLAIVGLTLLGVDFEADHCELSAEELTAAVHHMMDALDYRLLPGAALWQRLPLPGLRRFARSLEKLEALVQRIIAERECDEVDRGDLLSMLLLARDAEGDGSGMSRGQLRDEVMTMFLAGHETIANALNWSWLLLAQNPECEAKLHAELAEVLGGRMPTAADLPALPYSRAVLCEAMRLYPPGWAMARRALSDCTIGGHEILAGSTVMVSQWVLHRDARYFPEPEVFRPERWLDGSQNDRPKFAYFPFGGGARFCIGEGFAWLEGILTLATLAQKWRLLLEPQIISMQPVLTLRPRGGIKMKAVRRHD